MFVFVCVRPLSYFINFIKNSDMSTSRSKFNLETVNDLYQPVLLIGT